MVELSPKIMMRCGIFEDYFGAEFGNYQVGDDGYENTRKEALLPILDYCKHIDNALREGIGLFLYGSNGSGKTHLTVATLKHGIRAGYTGQMITLQGAYAAHMDSVFGDEDAREFLNRRIKNVQVLVLDDVLKETTKTDIPTFFDNLLRHRMRRRLITIMSSNGTIEDFKNRYGNSLVSMVMGKTIPVHMVWPDYRKEVLSPDILKRLHGGK